MLKIILSLFACCSCFNALACDENQQHVLDGLTFAGKFKANNTFLRIGVKGSVSFKNGYLVWIADNEKNKKHHEKLNYQITCDEDIVTFKTLVQSQKTESQKDQISWQGKFNGTKIYDVNAKWTRIEKDFIHDLLLPKVVTFKFNPD